MSEQEYGEPVMLDYAGAQSGRFAALSQGEPDVNARRAGLRLWALVTLGLYLAAALAIYVPLVIFCFWKVGEPDHWKDVGEFFTLWPLWLVLGVFLLAQVLLLVVPVRAAWDYQIKPRRLCVPIATTCMLLGFLVGGVVFSEVVVFAKLDNWNISDVGVLLAWLALMSVSWLVWWIIFRKYARTSPDQVMNATRRWLLRGSIVELLVAIGCHIWVRRRGDCSSPAITFLAICAGFATMLCAFGPGVFYLLVARARRMRPRPTRHVG